MDIEDVRMTVRLPKEAVAFLDEEAKREFTSRNALIVRAVRAVIKEKGSAEAASREGASHADA